MPSNAIDPDEALERLSDEVLLGLVIAKSPLALLHLYLRRAEVLRSHIVHSCPSTTSRDVEALLYKTFETLWRNGYSYKRILSEAILVLQRIVNELLYLSNKPNLAAIAHTKHGNSTFYELQIVQNVINMGLHKNQLLKLALVDGLSHQQISDLLGLPLGTVKSDIHRLKKKLQSYGEIIDKILEWEYTDDFLE
jgi:hypothetical protein